MDILFESNAKGLARMCQSLARSLYDLGYFLKLRIFLFLFHSRIPILNAVHSPKKVTQNFLICKLNLLLKLLDSQNPELGKWEVSCSVKRHLDFDKAGNSCVHHLNKSISCKKQRGTVFIIMGSHATKFQKWCQLILWWTQGGWSVISQLNTPEIAWLVQKVIDQ